MKKILITLFLTLLFSANSVFAQSFNVSSVKKFFNTKFSKGQVEKKVETDTTTKESDSMTPSEEAILFYSDNNLKNALASLLSIKEGQRTAQDWLLIGNILQDQDRISDAVFMYKRVLLVNPESYKAYYNLGNIYLDEDKPFMAIENYRKANKFNNKFPYAYYNLGCAYLKTGNLKKAKIAFLKAIELKNSEPDFHYNLAYTYKMLKKDELAKQYLGFYNKIMESR